MAQLQTLINGGYTFIGRYLAGSYALAASEKSFITGGGLYIISIWEKGSPISSFYFTTAKGTSIATEAINAATAVKLVRSPSIKIWIDNSNLDNFFKGVCPIFIRCQIA